MSQDETLAQLNHSAEEVLKTKRALLEWAEDARKHGMKVNFPKGFEETPEVLVKEKGGS